MNNEPNPGGVFDRLIERNKQAAEASEIEVEFMLSWARDNPQLFEERFNKFFDDYGDGYAITSKARRGCIVLHAKLK